MQRIRHQADLWDSQYYIWKMERQLESYTRSKARLLLRARSYVLLRQVVHIRCNIGLVTH